MNRRSADAADHNFQFQKWVTEMNPLKVLRCAWKTVLSCSVIFLFLAALAGAVTAGAASAPGTPADLDSLRGKIQAKLDELREGADFPGTTVGIVLPDGRSAAVATGLADREAQIPMDPSSRMFAGSAGKTYASAVMLQLVQEEKAELDARISRWFGEEAWFARLPNGREITLRMLLSHTSGIPEHVWQPEFLQSVAAQPDKTWTGEEIVAYILDQEPLFPAGTNFSYADTNYIVVGMIIEKITGHDYYAELQERLLRPLHLHNTAPQTGRAHPGLAAGYTSLSEQFALPEKVAEKGRYAINPQFEWTGGGVLTNAEELARWAKALYEGKVLNAATLKELLKPMGGSRRIGGQYGLGVQIRDSEWGVSYGHSGIFPGYLTNVEYFPELQIAVAVQFNTDNGRQLKRSLRAYVAEIVRVLLDELDP